MDKFFSLVFVAAAVGIWYFIKKTPNKKNRNIAIIVAVISSLLVAVFHDDSESKESKPKDKIEKTSKSYTDEEKAEIKEMNKKAKLKEEEEKEQKKLDKEKKKQDKIDKKEEPKKAKEQKYEDIHLADVSFLRIKSKLDNDDLELSFAWRNDSLDGKKSFIQAQLYVEVFQDEKILEEVDNLFGTVGGNISYKAKQGISTPLVAKYKLNNTTSPITVKFGSLKHADTIDDSHEFIINIQ